MGSGNVSPMAKKTILVVEDDPIILTLLEHILGREGYEIVKAGNGKEALEKAKAMPVPPDVVLSDVMLPFISGIELVAALRALDGWEKVALVMLTAKGQESDIKRAFDAGADDYLVKPFQPGELVARLRRFLR